MPILGHGRAMGDLLYACPRRPLLRRVCPFCPGTVRGTQPYAVSVHFRVALSRQYRCGRQRRAKELRIETHQGNSLEATDNAQPCRRSQIHGILLFSNAGCANASQPPRTGRLTGWFVARGPAILVSSASAWCWFMFSPTHISVSGESPWFAGRLRLAA